MNLPSPESPFVHPLVILRKWIHAYAKSEHEQSKQLLADMTYIAGFIIGQERKLNVLNVLLAITLLQNDNANLRQQLAAAQASGTDATQLQAENTSLESQISQLNTESAANDAAVTAVLEQYGYDSNGNPLPGSTNTTPITLPTASSSVSASNTGAVAPSVVSNTGGVTLPPAAVAVAAPTATSNSNTAGS